MSIKKIYIVRHGQTEFNRQGIVQGSGVDASLNEVGRAQATAFFRHYGQVPFDKIYTSTLKRTIESVEGFLDRGIPHQTLAGLNEISWGVKEGRPITAEEDRYYQWMLRKWRAGETHHRIEGGESPEDVAARQGEAWQQVMAGEDERHVLIAMHGRAMRILLCRLLERPLREMDHFEHHNMCLYQLDFDGKQYTVRQHNDLLHLNGLFHEVRLQ